MKVLFAVLLVTLAANRFPRIEGKVGKSKDPGNDVSDRAIEIEIDSVIESARAMIPDPLEVSNFKASLKVPQLRGEVKIHDLKATGLSNFKFESLHIDPESAQAIFRVKFPEITFDKDYWQDVTILDYFRVFGSGHSNVTINNLVISGSTKMSFKEGLVVKNLRITVRIDSGDFDITGLFNDEGMSRSISSFMTSHAPKVLMIAEEFVSDFLSPLAERGVNAFLSGRDVDLDGDSLSSSEESKE